jgi:DNA-binding response OmpR family regulator
MAATQSLLIVEDDAITCEVLADFLHQAGFKVICAVSGAEALAMLDWMHPDLILLDTLSPTLDERHFLRQVKVKNLPPIPIVDVATTILTHQWTVDRGFVHKPFDLNAVLEAVWSCLEE